jgi:S1-C subfamily serine protease
MIVALILSQINLVSADDDADNEIVLLIDNNKALVNGSEVSLDENNNITPIIINSRTYLPVRFIAELFGATVTWNEVTKSVDISGEVAELSFNIGQLEYTSNNESYLFETPPFIMHDRTYIQLSTLVSLFKKEVVFNDGIIIIGDSKPSASANYVAYLKEKLNDSNIVSSQTIYEQSKDSIVKIKSANGTGSGFFVDSNLVLTSQHVVGIQTSVEITDYNGDHYDADIYWIDERNDLALLEVKDYLSPSTLSFSDESLTIGDTVYTIGNPENLDWSFSQGIISSFRDDVHKRTSSIQTDVEVTFGSSGGPLLNDKGDVIGVIKSGLDATDIHFASDIKELSEKMDSIQPVDITTVYKISDAEFEMVSDLINKNFSALLSKDRERYNEDFHVDSKFNYSHLDNYTAITELLYNPFIRDKFIKATKENDTFLVNLSFTSNYIDYMFIYHLSYDKTQNEMKINGNVMIDHYDKDNINLKTDIEHKEPSELSIVDHIFDETSHAFYKSDLNSQSIIKYDVVTQQESKLQFDYKPQRMVIKDNLLYVALPTQYYDGLREKEDTNGYVGVVDLKTFTLNRLIKVENDPFDVAVKKNVLFVSDGSSSDSELLSIDLTSDQLIDRTKINRRSAIEANAIDNRLVTMATDYRETEYKVFLISNGSFDSYFTSIRDSQLSKLPQFTLTPDGSQVVNYNGTLYTTGHNTSQTNPYRRIRENINAITFDKVNNRMFVALKDNPEIRLYTLDPFELTDTLESSADITAMGYYNNTLYQYNDLDNSYMTTLLEPVKVDPSTIDKLKIGDLLPMTFDPNEYIYLRNSNALYLTDNNSNRLYKFDLESEKMSYITLPHKPENLQYNGELYFTQSTGENDGRYITIAPETLAIINEVDLGISPVNMAILRETIVVSGHDQSNYIRIYDKKTLEIISQVEVQGDTYFRTDTSTPYLYAYTPAKPGTVVSTYEYSEGALTLIDECDSIYPFSTSFIFRGYKKQIITSIGTVFHASDTVNYSTPFDAPMGSVLVRQNRIYIPQDKNGLVYEYDVTGHTLLNQIFATYEVKYVRNTLNGFLTIQENNGSFYLGYVKRY